jgi:hypothetical protein
MPPTIPQSISPITLLVMKKQSASSFRGDLDLLCFASDSLNLTFFDLRICNLTNIHSAISIEKLVDFFHGCVSRLHNKEVDDSDFKHEKDAVENIVLPRQGFERNGVDILVEEECGTDAEIEPSVSLRSETIRQNFSRV